MQNITDIEMLQQTINIQSCLMAGHSIEAIFRNESSFIFDETGAQMGALCTFDNNSLQLEFMIEKNNIFHHFLKSYGLQRDTLVLETLGKKIIKTVKQEHEYIRSNTIEDFLIDSVSKDKIKHLQNLNNLTESLVLPIYSFENRFIGCLFLCFKESEKIDLERLLDIRKMMQTVIRPFYDEKIRRFTSKRIEMSRDIPLLTNKEKYILKKLLAAKSYTQIAEELHISVNTVKTHVKHIYTKYEVKSKLELANKVNTG